MLSNNVYKQKVKAFTARKKLGQNFLISDEYLNIISDQAYNSTSGHILEIGPGLGFLTHKLLQKASYVYAVEIDPKACQELDKISSDRFKLWHQDILKVNIPDLTSEKVTVIANIPYYITTPILLHLLGEIYDTTHINRAQIDQIYILVQKEVGNRILANETTKGKDYGLLTIFVNYWCNPELITYVPAHVFYPTPKVDSAFLKLTIRNQPLVEVSSPQMLHSIASAIYQSRRKTIKNSLLTAGFAKEIIVNSLELAKINENIRGEKLSMELLGKLSDSIYSMVSSWN